MRVTEDFCPARDGKRLMIEFSGSEIVKHQESHMEQIMHKVYKKSLKISDMLMWLSEYAKTEEELLESPTQKGTS